MLGKKFKPEYVPAAVFDEYRELAKVGEKFTYFYPDVVKHSNNVQEGDNKSDKDNTNTNENDDSSKETYDVYKDENVPCYMFRLVVEELGPDETLTKLYDIEFEEKKNDPGVRKAFDWLKTYGFTNEELKERWATRSEWSFRRYIDSW